ncbi:proline dehydrogenase [Naumannella sp. ID2617S]|nr:proline dehydrogenase [Naumannella sp. ID2617S]
MLGSVVRTAARNGRLAALLAATPAGHALARRHLGLGNDEALPIARALADTERLVALEPLRHRSRTGSEVAAAAEGYRRLLAGLSEAGVEGTELSVRLSALSADADPGAAARAQLAGICTVAVELGHRVNLDPEGPRGARLGLDLAADLHGEFGSLGVTLAAHLHRAELEAQRFSELGMRVRLVRLSVHPVPDAAHTDTGAVDLAYVRCLRTLMEGPATPVVATHDPRLLAIGADLVRRHGRGVGDQEFLLDHRMHPVDRRRLTAAGLLVRTNLPFGEDWSGYLARRLAEEPSGLAELPRGLVRTAGTGTGPGQ